MSQQPNERLDGVPQMMRTLAEPLSPYQALLQRNASLTHLAISATLALPSAEESHNPRS